MNVVRTLGKVRRAMPRGPSTNYLCHTFDVNPYALLPPNPIILDVASKDARAKYAFGRPPEDAVVYCLDIEPVEGVDLVADAHDLPLLSSECVDCVLCVSFLYAARYPSQVMREIHRVLKPGGIVYISVPYVFPQCPAPSDYYRFSSSGLEVLCENFERLDGGFNRGPASTMHELIVRFLAMSLCFGKPSLYAAWRYLFKWPFFWMKYMDKYLAHYKMAYEIHSGSYFIGRKMAGARQASAASFQGFARSKKRPRDLVVHARGARYGTPGG
jgi:SAM-dependent methyltransferase